MVFVKRFAAVLSVAVLAAWPGALVQAQAPDLILHNGKIVTVDSAFSIAQALAIRGDRFVAVGTNDAVRRTAGPATRVIDLRGRTVIPGLIDGHLHNEGGAADEEPAAGDLEFRHGCHGRLPHAALAAMWIASRTCWKVPQRQMLVIAASMSASLGLGFVLRSAATAMIMPDWQ